MLRFVLLLTVFVLCTDNAFAQKRVALVIGNDEYTTHGKLVNSVRDAELVASTLSSVGFGLVGGKALTNLTKTQFEEALEKFAVTIQKAEVAMFYYAGHGMQVGEANYLLPIDAPVPNQVNLDFRFIKAATISSLLSSSESRLNMMLLDACRNNPIARRGRTVAVESFAAMKVTTAGMLISFSTQPGALADDGEAGKNGPYAAELARAIKQAGADLFTVFNEVGIGVMEKTNNEQQPWMTASPIKGGRFYFTAPIVVASKAPVSNDPVIKSTPVVIPQAVPRFDSKDEANRLMQEGYRKLSQNDLSGARASLTQAIALDNEAATAFSYRGFAWYLEGNALLKRALDPQTDSVTRQQLAASARELFRTSFPDLDQAIRLNPAFANALRHRGNAILATYKTLKVLKQPTNQILDRALEDLIRASKIDSSNMYVWNSLGEAHNLRGEYSQAIESFNQANRVNPKFVAPYSGRCLAYRMQGNLSEARKNADFAAQKSDEFASKPCLREAAIFLR